MGLTALFFFLKKNIGIHIKQNGQEFLDTKPFINQLVKFLNPIILYSISTYMYRQIVSLQDVIGLGRNLIRRRASSVTNFENCCWSYRSPTPGSQDIRDIENISIWPPEPPSACRSGSGRLAFTDVICSPCPLASYSVWPIRSLNRRSERRKRKKLQYLFFGLPPWWHWVGSGCIPLLRARVTVVKPSLIVGAIAITGNRLVTGSLEINHFHSCQSYLLQQPCWVQKPCPRVCK